MAEDPVSEQSKPTEPPKVNPLAKPVGSTTKTIALHPVSRGSTQTGLKPGLRLPPKPGMPTAGLKLPTQNAIRPGVRLPTQNALRPGIKLPPKPGIASGTLKLPTRPPIVRPGATVSAKPLPDPVSPAPAGEGAQSVAEKPVSAPPAVSVAAPAAPAATKPAAEGVPPPVAPAAEQKPAPAQTTPKLVKPITRPMVKPIVKPGAPHATKPLAPPLPKPIAPVPPPVSPASATALKTASTPAPADPQGVAKLPTVEMNTVPREDISATVPKPMDQLKSVTQKLKGVTQQIPQQAILRKTGIIAEDATTAAQKEAAKHKTARISLSDAMGVAPVKSENAPMKTIRIRRPIDIPGATTEKLAPKPTTTLAPGAETAATEVAPEAGPANDDATSITQRKTLKIARPGGGIVRPTGKFGVKRPGALAVKRPGAVVTEKADAAASPNANGGEQAVADIADIPDIPMAPVRALPEAEDGPAWVWGLFTVVQLAACAAVAALAWFLWQNTQGLF